jgi:hypothetical protein
VRALADLVPGPAQALIRGRLARPGLDLPGTQEYLQAVAEAALDGLPDAGQLSEGPVRRWVPAWRAGNILGPWTLGT